jgi:hypothetical protein
MEARQAIKTFSWVIRKKTALYKLIIPEVDLQKNKLKSNPGIQRNY